jgi:hypothetical protein
MVIRENFPLRVRIRLLSREILRWLKLEWRFHVLLAIVAVAVSADISFHKKDAVLFARCCASLTVIGLLMTLRTYFRGAHNPNLRDTTEAHRPPFSLPGAYYDPDQAAEADRHSLVAGIVIGVLGTVLWAFGDLIIASWIPAK